MKIIALALLLAVVAQAQEDLSKVTPKTQFKTPLGGGKWPSDVQTRLSGSTAATRGQFPHHVAIYMDSSSFCSGSLISRYWVLTAAHCVSGFTSFNMHLGSANQTGIYDEQRIIATASTKVVHSGYDNKTLKNDIALLKLDFPVPPLNDLAKPIQLPRRSQMNVTFAGVDGTVSGWGRVANETVVLSNVLNFIDVKVINNSVCQQNYSSVLPTSVICVNGDRGQGLCGGDAGGPLEVTQADVRTLVGVAIFVPQGCSGTAPSGFTRVTSYLDWISANTGIAIN